MNHNRIERGTSSSRLVSPDPIAHLLPRSLQPFISTSHPASLLLFDRGLSFQTASWKGKPFLLIDDAGIFFLPAPPPWSIPDAAHPLSETLFYPDFWNCLSRTLQEWNGGIAGRLDSLPTGLRAQGFVTPEKTDTEYILHQTQWNTLQGRAFRNHRWERNRLFRNHPEISTAHWNTSYRLSAGKLIERFFSYRSTRSNDPYARLLLEDQYRAHEKALNHAEELGLTGLVLLSGMDVIAITWFALIPEECSAICFLEARNPELTGVSTFFTQEFFRLFPRFLRLNIQGGSGIINLEQAKKFDSPQACSPIHSQSLSSAKRS